VSRKTLLQERFKEVFILYHVAPLHTIPNKFSIVARFQVLNGMLTLVTPLLPLFGWSLARIVSLVLMSHLKK
jgi:hypothetical protein